MARKIVITSGKGGVGKTTICSGLGKALAKVGVKVCMVDLDTQLNNLDCALQVENKVVFDIVDVVSGRVRVSQALLKVCENLFLLPSCQGFLSKAITTEKLSRVFKVLDELFEVILIDSPAGLEEGFLKSIQNASESIIVATPHIFSIRDACKTLSVLKENGIELNYLVINRARGDLEITGEEIMPENAASLINCKLVGVIPDDDEISINGTVYSEPFDMLCENILCGGSEIYDATKKYKGIFGKIKRVFKRA